MDVRILGDKIVKMSNDQVGILSMNFTRVVAVIRSRKELLFGMFRVGGYQEFPTARSM